MFYMEHYIDLILAIFLILILESDKNEEDRKINR